MDSPVDESGRIVDPEFRDKVISQFVTLWLNPEIARRRERGTLPDGFRVYAAQVLLAPDGSAPEVRFNEEVKMRAKVKWNREPEVGDSVRLSNIKEVEYLELTDEDENCGHVSMLFSQRGWHCQFSFRYNAGRIRDLLVAASEFVEAADMSLSKGFLRPFVDSLWSGVELLSKGLLLAEVDRQVLQSKSHKYIRSEINRISNQARIDGRFPELLNRLSLMRDSARYLSGVLTLSADDARHMLDVSRALMAEVGKYAEFRQLK